MGKKFIILFFIYVSMALAFAFTGCGDSGGGSSSNNSTTTFHVYIAGAVGNDTNGEYPVYWKDETINYLSLKSGYNNGVAIAITFDSVGTIYCAGEQWNTGGTIRGYWKGSAFIALENSSTYSFFKQWEIAVDTNGDIWVAANVGSSGDDAAPLYWKNSVGPFPLSTGTNVLSLIADASGNVYFTGTTGGGSIFASTINGSWTPTYWKNGINPIALRFTNSNYTYGIACDITIDTLGNLFIVGSQSSPNPGVPVYWKTTNGVWGSAIIFNRGSFSTNSAWAVGGIAVDSSGNIHAEAFTSSTALTAINSFRDLSATLIYWEGASIVPIPLSLMSNYTYCRVVVNPGAVDYNGDYYIVGSLAKSAADAINNKGIPVYWKNGSNPVQLQLGVNGVANTYGSAFSIAIHE
jgi:hypothetical protein